MVLLPYILATTNYNGWHGNKKKCIKCKYVDEYIEKFIMTVFGVYY